MLTTLIIWVCGMAAINAFGLTYDWYFEPDLSMQESLIWFAMLPFSVICAGVFYGGALCALLAVVI